MNAVFVSYRPFVEGSVGGVQACTREYIDTIEQAGFSLKLCLFDSDRRLLTRVRRRLFSSPYFGVAEPHLAERMIDAIARSGAEIVFLNQVALASLVPTLRARVPKCRIVVLSHGLESTDLLHIIRLRARLPISAKVSLGGGMLLGSALIEEAAYRPDIDAVCVISPFDADLERWLGARRIVYLPRVVSPAPLDWQPVTGRFGFVGTMDHAPNLEGLVRVLDALGSELVGAMRIRIVGGPQRLGDWLERRYATVDYLGPLDDQALRSEAASWNAFLHPIFCLARGCSTKLATALSWQIPIVTTEYGRRGYEWKGEGVSIGNNPAEFIQRCTELMHDSNARKARAAVVEASTSSPTLRENSALLRDALVDLRRN